MAISPAPTLIPSAVDVWRHAIEAIPADKPPCRNLTPARWAEMRAAAIDFCDRFGAQAHALGWTAPQLFGVHPKHGTLRIEMCGALMGNPRKVQGVEADRVLFGNASGYRNGTGQTWGPPIWEFARRG